jgi:thermitase
MAPQGWDVSTNSPAVPIAIIDYGIDPNHPDLCGKLLSGYSFLLHGAITSDLTKKMSKLYAKYITK